MPPTAHSNTAGYHYDRPRPGMVTGKWGCGGVACSTLCATGYGECAADPGCGNGERSLRPALRGMGGVMRRQVLECPGTVLQADIAAPGDGRAVRGRGGVREERWCDSIGD